jgi:hypothetical protein
LSAEPRSQKTILNLPRRVRIKLTAPVPECFLILVPNEERAYSPDQYGRHQKCGYHQYANAVASKRLDHNILAHSYKGGEQ